mgnify:CR=1 FL=1
MSKALSDYVRAHYNALFDYGVKLTGGDAELAKDCIQETFVAFWQHRDQWDSLGSVRAYLLVSLRRKVTDAYRARQRFVPTLTLTDYDEEFVAQTDFAFTSDEADGKEYTPCGPLAQALDRLTRRQREAIFLRFFGELDYPDVARVMGVRERTVYNLVHEGLQQLRAQLPSRRTLLAGLSAGLALLCWIFF